MTQMAKVTINWTVPGGGPGYTNLYFRDFSGTGNIDQAQVNAAVAKTDTWLNAWVAQIPSTVTVGVDSTVEAIEDTTGELQAFFTATPEAPSAGSGNSLFAAPAGGVVSWYTNVVKNGRRIRGRSFMVPLSTTAWDTGGTLATTFLTAVTTATNTFIDPTGIADLGIWSRPTLAAPASGQWAAVTSFRIPDMAAILTSRRS